MCRLFGFRSVVSSAVHRSLVEADNALAAQSSLHPDGWGLAYYVFGTPHVIKSSEAALEDSLFHRVSGVVFSDTVLAHIRKATVGDTSIINSHPFQFANWSFIHNGNIKNFAKHRNALLAGVAEDLRKFVLGDTDSEIIFFLVLSEIAQSTAINDPRIGSQNIVAAIKNTIQFVENICGPFLEEDLEGVDENYLTFVLSNGQSIYAHHGGKRVRGSYHKTKCSESDVCPSYLASACEAPAKDGKLTHIVFSSEEIDGENVWQEMQPGDLWGADCDMKLVKERTRK